MEEDGFIQSVREAPYDEGLRLIYADWLDERGDPRAEFLRLESHLRRTNAQTHGYPASLVRWLDLRTHLSADWLDGLGWRVDGLLLPRALVDLLARGRWPSSSGEIEPLRPAWGAIFAFSFQAYSLETMRSETLSYPPEPTPMWLGKPDPEHPPGDIDLRLAVLIADLGIGSDQAIALDYRVSLEQPRVLALEWPVLEPGPTVPEGDRNRWVEVAPNFQAFWELIGL